MFFLKIQFNSNYRKISWWKLYLYCTIRYIYTTPDIIKGGGDLVGHITVTKEVCSIQRVIHTVFIEEWSANGIWEDKKSTRRGGLQQWTGRAVVTVSALVAAASRASIGRVGACWPVAMTTGSHNTAPPPHYDAVILIYSIITNVIDGAVMLFTRTSLHVWQRYSRALLSYPALTSLVSLVPCVSLSSPCGRRHYANECPRSMAKLSTASSFVYLRVRSTVFAVHNREIRLSKIYKCVRMPNSLFSIHFLAVIRCIYTTKFNLNKMFLNISTFWHWE